MSEWLRWALADCDETEEAVRLAGRLSFFWRIVVVSCSSDVEGVSGTLAPGRGAMPSTAPLLPDEESGRLGVREGRWGPTAVGVVVLLAVARVVQCSELQCEGGAAELLREVRFTDKC